MDFSIPFRNKNACDVLGIKIRVTKIDSKYGNLSNLIIV